MARVVGHLDLNYFYAQVEELENSSLKGRPVIVCVFSGRTSESGVVSTANYIARELGVRSAMPIALAKKRLQGKDVAIIPMKHEKYEAYSKRIMEIVGSQVDVIEQTGIDETFFDITAMTNESYEKATTIAIELKQKISQTERLACSVGIAPNKVVAKIASDFKKPDGLTVVPPKEVMPFIFPLPVEKLYGVGIKTSKILKEQAGVHTIGDLATTDISLLKRLFEPRFATYLHDAANGIDEEPVEERGEATQISRMITLKRDSKNVDEIISQLSQALQDIHTRAETKNVFFKSISVIGILPNLAIRTRSKTLESPTNEVSVLSRVTRELLESLVQSTGELRRAGVRVADFAKVANQTSLAEFLG